MSTRRPRLVYLYTEIAQRGIHHISCRQLLAALKREFDVTIGYALYPSELVHAGLYESLSGQLLPE